MARTRAEKLSLMQDISRMELEGSQLNLQNVSHQSAIPETLALQRQTSLLEAEIQNHRSLQYAQLKKSNQSQEELCLNDWSGDPCHDISNQKPRRKVDKCTAPKVDLGELKVGSVIPNTQIRGADIVRSGISETLGKKQRGQKEEKQGYIPNFPHLQGQMTITTPGGAKLPQKLKQVLALPGDKSSFSVTPFLNRANINGIASDITSDEVGKSPLAGEQGFDREILCEKF
ncbi:hypothetical protein PRK78_001037 [Emydomyces testavorans]|uniref:Uncharacterized protein n=1 Tax=Emydomyces testavorans TaxID=2070801 RepID=A0AAF0DBU4_9EURO|nr:hypothetical protein PRK78_001037 [Emydomyces testavorans]